MSPEIWTAILASIFGGVAALIAAGAAGYVVIMQGRAKVSQDDTKQKVSVHEMVINRQELVIGEMTTAIEILHGAHLECREESAELRVYIHMFHDGWSRMASELRGLGHEPGDVPNLPPQRPHSMSKDSSEFIARTAQHSADLVKKLDGSGMSTGEK